MTRLAAFTALALAVGGCTTPDTEVVIANRYAAASGDVIYRAQWLEVAFTTPIPPGEPSSPEPTAQASANTAYAVLAPGYDAASPIPPLSLVALQSNAGYALDLDDTLVIPVDDHQFTGNCAAGSTLTQDQADFITQRVFQAAFAGFVYDAATCTITRAP